MFFERTCETVEENLKNSSKMVRDAIENLRANPEEKKDEPEAEIDIDQWLVAQKFAVQSLAEEGFYYKSELDTNRNRNSKAKIKAIRKDISILSSSLPDGIFVRVDEDSLDMIKVLIIGPRGTPYENGCFFFDLYLPPDYPQVNPKMIFLTTGSHAYRFNPNLYNEGKICISLLWTWSGPGWDPETSTLLQLLVSIQALVFVDYPIENEPSYESRALDPDSLAYNKGLHHGTLLYAMMDHLNGNDPSTPKCFQDIVRAHLYQKRDEIRRQLERWEAEDANAADYCGYFSWVNSLRGKVWADIKAEMLETLNTLELPKLTFQDDEDDE